MINTIRIQLLKHGESVDPVCNRFDIRKYPCVAKTLCETEHLIPTVTIPSEHKMSYKALYKPILQVPLPTSDTNSCPSPNQTMATDQYIRNSHSRMGVLG